MAVKGPLLRVFVLSVFLAKGSRCKIICDVEEYVRSGMEFAKCQDSTLKSFHEFKEPGRKIQAVQPCSTLERIIDSCALLVRHCFDHQGWIRGKEVFLDLLALDYPEHKYCGIFQDRVRNGSVAESFSSVTDELCSVDEEVALLRGLRSCAAGAQNEFVRKMVENPPKPILSSASTHVDDDVFYFPSVCTGLQVVNNRCYVGRLSDCYPPDDQKLHMAYLLEDLKVTGIMLSAHLITAMPTNNSDGVTVDVAGCPLFHESILYDSSPISAILTASVVVPMLALMIVVFAGIFMLRQFRVIPKLRARFVERTPYEDIVITEQIPAVAPTTVDTNASVRRQLEGNNAAIASLSNDLASRHKSSESIVNTFALAEDDYESRQSVREN